MKKQIGKQVPAYVLAIALLLTGRSAAAADALPDFMPLLGGAPPAGIVLDVMQELPLNDATTFVENGKAHYQFLLIHGNSSDEESCDLVAYSEDPVLKSSARNIRNIRAGSPVVSMQDSGDSFSARILGTRYRSTLYFFFRFAGQGPAHEVQVACRAYGRSPKAWTLGDVRRLLGRKKVRLDQVSPQAALQAAAAGAQDPELPGGAPKGVPRNALGASYVSRSSGIVDGGGAPEAPEPVADVLSGAAN